MAAVKGKEAVLAHFAALPKRMPNVLRGAARAGADVIADEARDRCISDEVTAAIKVRTRTEEHRVVARVVISGPGSFKATWLEYGTDAHFISVDDSARKGMSVGRVNRGVKEGSLVIGGQFVGKTVLHPGAQAHPFLRPALDIKADDAVRAVRGYIAARITRTGLIEPEGDDE